VSRMRWKGRECSPLRRKDPQLHLQPKSDPTVAAAEASRVGGGREVARGADRDRPVQTRKVSLWTESTRQE